MEVERRLNSIQWKVLRSFLVATIGSTLLFLLFFSLFWLSIFTSSGVKQWFTTWIGHVPTMDEFVHYLILLLLFSGVAGILCGLLVGFYMGRKLKRSLHDLSWAAESLTRGDLDFRITVEGDDEIAELADQFNLMANRIESQVATLQRLVQKNAELHQQAKQSATHEERQRLARELHDSISQQLFAISMSTAAVARLIDQDPEKAKRQFYYIEEMAASAQAEMRALLLHLRPIQLSGRNLSDALEELLNELKQKHAIEYIWDIDPMEDLPLGVEEHLFRIVQEGISNALRHSHAKQIQVSLKRGPGLVVLKIKDNGIGLKTKENEISSSMGLGNIGERVNEMGGLWEIISSKGKGTVLEIRVPLLMRGEERDGEDPSIVSR